MSLIKRLGKKIIYTVPSSYVLMFHHVTSSPDIKCSGCILDTDKFYNIVETLSSFKSLEYVLHNHNQRNVAITFDDGLADLYTIAYPFLIDKNIPFTAFIITDFLDNPGYITTDQLKEMSKNPLVTIGSHGLSHKIFTEIDETQKLKELTESKKKLEEIIGKEVNIFAFSHGRYDKNSLKHVKRCYKYAMSVKGFPLNFITKNRVLIPRYNIDNTTFDRQIELLCRIGV